MPNLSEGLTQYLSMWIDGPLIALRDEIYPVEIPPLLAEIRKIAARYTGRGHSGRTLPKSVTTP